MNLVKEILEEVERATKKFPKWPTDPLHAVAVLGEEFGELTKAVLQFTYEPHKTSPSEIRTEAIQTAAMALRFAASLDDYVYRMCGQHRQPSDGECNCRLSDSWRCARDKVLSDLSCPCGCHTFGQNAQNDGGGDGKSG